MMSYRLVCARATALIDLPGVSRYGISIVSSGGIYPTRTCLGRADYPRSQSRPECGTDFSLSRLSLRDSAPSAADHFHQSGKIRARSKRKFVRVISEYRETLDAVIDRRRRPRPATRTSHRMPQLSPLQWLVDYRRPSDDVKAYPFSNEFRGEIKPGEPLHDMWIRLTVDGNLPQQLSPHRLGTVRDVSRDPAKLSETLWVEDRTGWNRRVRSPSAARADALISSICLNDHTVAFTRSGFRPRRRTRQRAKSDESVTPAGKYVPCVVVGRRNDPL